MFRPGLGLEDGFWPGFSWLRLSKIPGQALGHGLGLFMAWLGLDHGLYYTRGTTGVVKPDRIASRDIFFY
jgi:hypothetical protein